MAESKADKSLPYELVQTDDKGRVLVATRSLEPGELVLKDTPFVYANWFEDKCIECDELHPSSSCSRVAELYPQQLASNMDEIVDVIMDVSAQVQSNKDSSTNDRTLESDDEEDGEGPCGAVDKARSLIKCLGMVHRWNAEKKKKKKYQKKKKQAKKKAESTSQEVDGEQGVGDEQTQNDGSTGTGSVPVDENWIPSDHPLANMFVLMGVHMEGCFQFVRLLRDCAVIKKYNVLPHNMSDAQVAKIVGILNANSHELENLGGSGVFLSASMMEHNCRANCNFSSLGTGKELCVYVMRPVSAGQHLAIDYNDQFYQPVAGRQRNLWESHEFKCTCDACTVLPDETRAFFCPHSNSCDGVVYPVGEGARCQEGWTCDVCKRSITQELWDRMKKAEKDVKESPPESIEDLEAISQQRRLHPRHYILFYIRESFARQLSSSSNLEDCRDAEKLWGEVLECMDMLLCPNHHSKVFYLDILAQVKIKLRDIEGARELFKKAYQISSVTNGKENTSTLQLKALAENTPISVEQLQSNEYYKYNIVSSSADDGHCDFVELK